MVLQRARRQRSWLALLAAAALTMLSALTGCSLFEAAPDSSCVARCEGRACGDDGCGGSCGVCLPGSACIDGLCVQAADDCSFDCAALGYECGDHCEASCGGCPEGLACAEHQCRCLPDCEGRQCDADDGCGGTCGPCPRPTSCDACALRLVLLTDEVRGGVRVATVAVDYTADAAGVPAGMADLRLQVTGGAALERVGLAPSLLSAGKELLVHPYTGRPYQLIREGVYRVVVTSSHSTKPMASGRWLFLRLRVDPAVSARPVQLRLLREAPVLAPMAADEALGVESFAGAVVLTMEVGDAQ